jgi:hypothetical protein
MQGVLQMSIKGHVPHIKCISKIEFSCTGFEIPL